MKTKVCAAVAGILLSLSSAAWTQQSDIADYYAACDRMRAIFTPLSSAANLTKPEAELQEAKPKFRAALAAMLSHIIGPVSAPKGFSGEGEWKGSMIKQPGDHALPGFSFSSGTADKTTYLLVSTLDLLRQWPSLPPEFKADPDLGFREGPLTAVEVMSMDVRGIAVGMLPVKAPAGIDAAFAPVTIDGNGILPIWPPERLSIYVRKGNRLFLIDAPLAVAFSPAVSCGVDLARATETFEESRKRALARQCWDGGGKVDPSVAAATQQAQKFIDDLATN